MNTPTRLALHAIALLSIAAGAAAQGSTPAELWQELESALPRRGTQSPMPVTPSVAIDWKKTIEKAEELMVRSGGTPVEPFATFYLGQFLYEAGRVDEAAALFETIRERFPDHPLVTCKPAKDQEPLVVKALADCASEAAFQARYNRKPPPDPELDPKLTATIHFSTGDVKLRFYKNVAPQHVANFIEKAKSGAYDGTPVGNVMAEMQVSLGDPPPAEPGTPVPPAPGQPHEFGRLSHLRGTVTMARSAFSDSSTRGFQVMLKPMPHSDFQQTIFAQVVDGIEIIDAISRQPLDQHRMPTPTVTIKSITVTE